VNYVKDIIHFYFSCWHCNAREGVSSILSLSASLCANITAFFKQPVEEFVVFD